MRVKSRLADVDFQFGPIERNGHFLAISSRASQSMKSKVYVSPQDVVSFLGRSVRSPTAWLFLLAFPFSYLKARKIALRLAHQPPGGGTRRR
jgi:hypothetical protein